jgi:hypothetical protein
MAPSRCTAAHRRTPGPGGVIGASRGARGGISVGSDARAGSRQKTPRLETGGRPRDVRDDCHTFLSLNSMSKNRSGTYVPALGWSTGCR